MAKPPQEISPRATRIMLVDDQQDRAATVESKLKAHGFELVSVLPTASGLLYQMQQLEPHVIMIDIESPDRDILESLAIIHEHHPLPVVMFSNHDDPDFIQQAVRSGVSVYMVRENGVASCNATSGQKPGNSNQHSDFQQLLYKVGVGVSVIASRCQILLANTGHSHSIINKALKLNNRAGLERADSVNTMKNTMFRNNY